MESFRFPENFLLGVATSAYQIEGSPLADGAASSNWHNFCHTTRKIHNRDTGDTACDFYHRYSEDIASAADMGCEAFRFSAAWSRIVPEPGRINQKGIDFYSRMTDEILARGMDPMCTLFHFDHPLWLEKEGGFVRRKSVDQFLFYSEALFKALGDRVKKWVPVNEPLVYALYGYFIGIGPPGKRLDRKGFFSSSHHLNLAHARCVELCREHVRDGQIGSAQHQIWFDPWREEHPADREAAARVDAIVNRMYMDPLFFGRYPDRVLAMGERFFPEGFAKDLETMKQPGDFVGINYYARHVYKHSPFIPFLHARQMKVPDTEWSEMWEVYPEGLYKLLKRMETEYANLPCYITENGYPLPEDNGPLIEDDPRIDYMKRHLRQTARALREGVDVRGYYAWSLLDNFEWILGNRMRFGLIRVDFETQKRTWKESARWYRDFIRGRTI